MMTKEIKEMERVATEKYQYENARYCLCIMFYKAKTIGGAILERDSDNKWRLGINHSFMDSLYIKKSLIGRLYHFPILWNFISGAYETNGKYAISTEYGDNFENFQYFLESLFGKTIVEL